MSQARPDWAAAIAAAAGRTGQRAQSRKRPDHTGGHSHTTDGSDDGGHSHQDVMSRLMDHEGRIQAMEGHHHQNGGGAGGDGQP